MNGTLAARIGEVEKHIMNPLLIQDQPWEMRLDNSYPNVVHDPSDPEGAYRLWYGGFIACTKCDVSQGENRVNAWHYANSSDGLQWSKPSLNIFDLSKCSQCSPAARAAGTANNVLMSGDGMGLYRDNADTNASRRFKAFGTGCFGAGGAEGCVSGVGVSADGLHWTDPQAINWPAPHRYDCHSNMVRDPHTPNGQFVMTTRDGFSSGSGRDIGIARGPASGAFAGWDTSVAPELVFNGTNEHQLYSQVTFPFLNVWLGLVAVFDTQDASNVGTVHTKLAWSNDTHHWQWLDSGGLTGRAFIPLGAPPAPVPPPPCASWRPVLDATGRNLTDCAAYRAGSRAAHTICPEGGRAQLSDRPLAECRAACSAAAAGACATVQWQGLESHAFDEAKDGRCFLLPGQCAPKDQRAYDAGKLWKTFCMDIATCTRARSATAVGAGNPTSPPFDSHIIFPAHLPITQPEDGRVRLYYMGGNGPHNGPRNTSLGLAMLRPDGFGGIGGSGHATTKTLPVPAGATTLTVTLDVLGRAGSVRVGAAGVTGLDAASATPVTGNSTDHRVVFASGRSFGELAGTSVELELVVESAMVYTVGFA
eukprot:g7180.t1